MRRRLLILCYFYPPLAGGGVHRVLSFTRYLPRHGWACTVVCAGENDYWVTDPSLVKRIPESTRVVRVSGGSALSAWLRVRGSDRGRRSGSLFKGLRRLSDWWLLPDSYAGWSRRARAVADRLMREEAYDAVLSSSPPDSVHLSAMALQRRHGVPWVADFRDPWISLYFREPPTGWHRARHAAMESAVLGGADLVLAASRTHADAPGERSGGRPRRIVHLPNGYEPAPADAGALDAPPPDDAFRLVFTGTLSLMPDTDVFLDSLHDVLEHEPRARRRLRVTIAGPYDTQHDDRAKALGLNGIVRFAGPVSHDASRALQRDAHVLLLWKPRDCPTMVPGKLYEYLDAGRPIVGLLDAEDEAAALVRRAGGTVVPPGDRTALAQALGRAYARWADGRSVAQPRPEWLSEYARPRIAGRLATQLDELVKAGA